jgi:hypothetical protein
MGASLDFWKAVVDDKSNFLERVLAILDENGVRYCVIGGVAVNAYADPVVTQNLDIVVATDQMEFATQLLSQSFRIHAFPYSLNVYDPGSKLQVQLQRRPELAAFLGRAQLREVMDLILPVAAPEDLLAAKVDAALEPTRRASKRLKDFADIARLVEAFPELMEGLPEEVRSRITL